MLLPRLLALQHPGVLAYQPLIVYVFAVTKNTIINELFATLYLSPYTLNLIFTPFTLYLFSMA